MEYSSDLLNKITQMGILGYPAEKIILVMEIKESDQFKKDFKNKNHEVFKRYQTGRAKADFAIDSKLFDMAKSGDLGALQKFEQRQHQNKKK